MVILARRCKESREPGFTLLELLLTLVLLLGLLGAVVFNFSTLKAGASLEEGSRQFEALIRFSAASAANSGRVVQFRFDTMGTSDAGEPVSLLRVMREVDPVGQPGVFEDLAEAGPLLVELRERIFISNVKGSERPANQGTNEFAMVEEMAVTPPISFFPDGSSDTVTITLGSRDTEDLREMTIHLAGVTGGIRSELKRREDWFEEAWMEEEEMPASATTPAQPVEATQPAFDETISTNFVSDEDWP